MSSTFNKSIDLDLINSSILCRTGTFMNEYTMDKITSSPNIHTKNTYNAFAIEPDSSHMYVYELISNNKKVLEVGAGSGIILAALEELKSASVTAVDMNPSPLLRERIARTIQADLNDANWINIFGDDEKFDAIIAADVLEHLYNPWDVLHQLKKLLRQNGEIIVSLPHASHAALIAALLNDNIDYNEDGLLDKTHIRFFGLLNIMELHHNAGLDIIDAKFVLKQPEDTELRSHWNKLSIDQKRLLSNRQEGLIYQVIVKSVISGSSDVVAGINLYDIPIQLNYKIYLNQFQRWYLAKFAELICTVGKLMDVAGTLTPFFKKISVETLEKGRRIYQASKEGYY
jgi:2-polyprenyl-3-methyl-5-hydroxy-6-metoxy-1,4-benzoquinol methylase